MHFNLVLTALYALWPFTLHLTTRLVDVPHCWHTKLETVITDIDRNILTASLLIFLAKQPHRINTSSLCKAHEQADYMSAGTVNDSLNPKNFLYIGRMLTFTVS